MNGKKIEPYDFALYLKSLGAEKINEVAGKFAVYKIGTSEILVPLAKELGDFRQRMFEALAELAEIEKRSVTAIVQDIDLIEFDGIRFCSKTLPGFTQYMEFLRKLHGFLLDAADDSTLLDKIKLGSIYDHDVLLQLYLPKNEVPRLLEKIGGVADPTGEIEVAVKLSPKRKEKSPPVHFRINW